MKKRITPWRAALNWYGAVFVFGTIAATLLTLPVFAYFCIRYGMPPPSPSYALLRSIQILQALVISSAGGYLAQKYFARRYDVSYKDMRFPMKVLAGGVPAACIAIVLLISIPKYGVTAPLLLTATLIFGCFSVMFLAGSFHFARKLTVEGQQTDGAITQESARSAAP